MQISIFCDITPKVRRIATNVSETHILRRVHPFSTNYKISFSTCCVNSVSSFYGTQQNRRHPSLEDRNIDVVKLFRSPDDKQSSETQWFELLLQYNLFCIRKSHCQYITAQRKQGEIRSAMQPVSLMTTVHANCECQQLQGRSCTVGEHSRRFRHSNNVANCYTDSGTARNFRLIMRVPASSGRRKPVV
jgi:hypothetical protein